jgi:ClpP class serine protease
MLAVVANILGRRLAGTSAPEAFTAPSRSARPAAPGGVAIIPIHGVLAPRINMLSDFSGGATFEQATALVTTAVADATVGTIILDWDSPGGSVAGATEFAHVLLQARTQKRIISVANHSMCSAACWAGVCATEVVATPSALVGSLGVYCLHEDLSAFLAAEGIKHTYIEATDSPLKTDGNSSEPLSDPARARLLAIVDTAMGMLVADVAAGRGVSPETVRAAYGHGATMTAAEALAAGLIDRVETLDAVIARAVTTPHVQRASLAAADLQLGYDLAALGLGL